jgi:hypothetical protein
LVSPSARVAYVALAGDLAVAAAKFGASALSGSTAMLTEAIHSTLRSVEKRVAYVYVRPRPNEGALAEANPPNIRDIALKAD